MSLLFCSSYTGSKKPIHWGCLNYSMDRNYLYQGILFLVLVLWIVAPR